MSNYPVFKKSGFSQKGLDEIRPKAPIGGLGGPRYNPALTVYQGKISGFDLHLVPL